MKTTLQWISMETAIRLRYSWSHNWLPQKPIVHQRFPHWNGKFGVLGQDHINTAPCYVRKIVGNVIRWISISLLSQIHISKLLSFPDFTWWNTRVPARVSKVSFQAQEPGFHGYSSPCQPVGWAGWWVFLMAFLGIVHVSPWFPSWTWRAFPVAWFMQEPSGTFPPFPGCPQPTRHNKTHQRAGAPLIIYIAMEITIFKR